jgi:DNA-binding NtrC family response regulator
MNVETVTKRRFKVLVVDDDPPGLVALTAALSVDFDVASAPSPTAAFELLNRGPVDVICSDYQMDDMDGLRFLELATKRLPHVGCVLVTGSSAYLRSSRDESRHYVLLKPYDPERLIGIVTQLALVTESKRSVDNRNAPARPRKLGRPRPPTPLRPARFVAARVARERASP